MDTWMWVLVVLLALGFVWYLLRCAGNPTFWKLAARHPNEAYDWFMREDCWVVLHPDTPEYRAGRPSSDYSGPFFLAVPKLNWAVVKVYCRNDDIEESQRRFVDRRHPEPGNERLGANGAGDEGGKLREVRVHPRGTRVTDLDQAHRLNRTAPTSFAKAQDLLIATENYLHCEDGAPTRIQLEQEVLCHIEDLATALDQDGFGSRQVADHVAPRDLLVEFLSEFSDAFPNWQAEYRALSDLIGRQDWG